MMADAVSLDGLHQAYVQERERRWRKNQEEESGEELRLRKQLECLLGVAITDALRSAGHAMTSEEVVVTMPHPELICLRFRRRGGEPPDLRGVIECHVPLVKSAGMRVAVQ